MVTKFLLAGDKFMPEIHLKQPGFTYSAFGPFTKSKERIEKFMQTRYTVFIYLFSTWYGLSQSKRFGLKNTIRQSCKR